jgi:hypothetical protein
LAFAAGHAGLVPADHGQAKPTAAQLTAYSLVAIRNDTRKEIKFTLEIRTASGMLVHKQQYAVAALGGFRTFDWTSNVRPTFTVFYTSFVTGRIPFIKEQTVTSRVKELSKPPTANQIIEFGAIWRFRSSGTGVTEVITLEAVRP